MRFKKMAGFAAGALVAGAMTVPALMGTAQAAGAATASVGIDATCTFNSYKLPVEGTLAVSAAGTAITAEFPGTLTFGAPSFVTTSKMAVKMGLSIGGATVDLSGERSYAPAIPGDAPIPLPALKGTAAAAPADGAAADVKSFSLVATALGTVNNIPCVINSTKPGAFKVAADPTPTAALPFTCTAFGKSFAYGSGAKVTAVKSGGSAAISVALDAMPNTAPVTLTNQSVDLTLNATVAGKAVALKGAGMTNMTPGVPFAMPVAKGSVTAAPSVAPVITGLSVLAAGSVQVDCTLPAPVQLAAVAVTKSTTCVAAENAAKAAAGKVPGATNAAKAAATKVAALNKKIKKAKKAKKKALKKQLKAAKSKASSANKALATAKAQAAAAQSAVVKAC